MSKLIRTFYIFLIFAFLYLPVFVLIIYSFNSGETMAEFSGFSFRWYFELLHNTSLISSLLNSLLVAFSSAGISVVFGFIGATAIVSLTNDKFKHLALSLNSLMIISPDVIIGVALLIFFTFFSIKLGFITVLLAHILFSTPLVIILLLPTINNIEQKTLDAARDLGANTWQLYTKVIIPLVTPNLIIAFLIALTYSLDDFAITYFVTGNGFSTLPITIYSIARQGLSLDLNALWTIIFLIVISSTIIAYCFQKAKGGKNA